VLQNRTVRTTFLFLVLGLVSECCLWQIKGNFFFLAVMAPVLSFAQRIESWLPFANSSTPIQNELIFVLPLTLLYFGLIGYWLRQILREEGFLKYFLLLCFVAFLVIIHWQAVIYINTLLYGTGSV